MAINIPASLPWPTNSSLAGFISVYDWDILVIEAREEVARLSLQLILCTGILPCSLFVTSRGSGLINRLDSGSIICLASSGCSSVTFEGIRFVCKSDETSISPFKIQGANLTFRNSSFSGCSTHTDGGVIQSYDHAVINILHSLFVDTYSAGFGGALCAVGGIVRIFSSRFSNCSALLGGGALWVSTYLPSYGSDNKSIDASVLIDLSTFQLCKTSESGGAILATSGLIQADGMIYLDILRTLYERCLSKGNGGAIHVYGSNVLTNIGFSNFNFCRSVVFGGAISVDAFSTVNISDSNFFSCRAGSCGGAVTALGNSRIILIRSRFLNNSADGLGGGAVNVQSSQILAENCYCSGNTAPAGGGGAVLFQGSIPFESVYHLAGSTSMNCDSSNFAVYGNCLASKFSHLQIIDSPIFGNPIFPGMPFRISFVKKDIYNQTILTDSSSILQIQSASQGVLLSGSLLNKMQNGIADFNLAVNPSFYRLEYQAGRAVATNNPILFTSGIDSEETKCTTTSRMESNTIVVTSTNGSFVCPVGSVLILDQSNYGSCSKCTPGSYSIGPLYGIKIGNPSCLSCPTGAICHGESNISFPVGIWTVIDGSYVLISCPDGHQLVNSVNGEFRQEVQHCMQCIPPQYILNPNSSNYTCQLWLATIYVELSASLNIYEARFIAPLQLKFVSVVATLADVSIQNVMLSELSENRRSSDSVRVHVKVAAHNLSDAGQVSGRLVLTNLNSALSNSGLPSVSDLSVNIISSSSSSETSLSVVIGACVGGFILLFLFAGFGFYTFKIVAEKAALKAFLQNFRNSKTGDQASVHHLPLSLQKDYCAESVIGKGAFGLVVQAKQKGNSKSVAIKIIVPEGGYFDEKELRQLRREETVLDSFTSKKCEHAVSLVGIGAVNIKPDLAWFIMDLLQGSNMEEILHSQSVIDDVECIKMSRNVLAALKVMHSEGLVHRDIKPANIMRCRAEKSGAMWDGTSYTYKLVDFGTALGIDEQVAKECMMTLVSNRQMGAGTPPYMSPEMFKEPENARYPSDLWSLGVSMFEVVTGKLPFESESDLLWSLAVAGNMNEKAPNVLDKLEEGRRPTFDNNLCRTIAKALEKKISERFQSGDEMHDAVYLCLIDKGEAFYSVFISYRVASEAPLARLIFDELNHSVTPGGHRVTVYWDSHRLVKGEDWEEGFSVGLLNSLCIFPLLSYGSTAPLAALREVEAETNDASYEGWEERPVGRTRLKGEESDMEDNVLKEFLIAGVLLKRQFSESRLPGEKGMLKLAYPILVGRQQPCGHMDYPKMGNFFHVQGGNGKYVDRPSPPTNRSVSSFLSNRAGMAPDVCQDAECTSVKTAMEFLTKLQGCQLYNHPDDLAEVELSREQITLVGKGYSGPPAALGGVMLTEEQKFLCRGGLDERQLRMLKAEVRNKRAEMHEIIDRAVGLSGELPQHGLGKIGSFQTSKIFKNLHFQPSFSKEEVSHAADLMIIKS